MTSLSCLLCILIDNGGYCALKHSHCVESAHVILITRSFQITIYKLHLAAPLVLDVVSNILFALENRPEPSIAWPLELPMKSLNF